MTLYSDKEVLHRVIIMSADMQVGNQMETGGYWNAFDIFQNEYTPCI